MTTHERGALADAVAGSAATDPPAPTPAPAFPPVREMGAGPLRMALVHNPASRRNRRNGRAVLERARAAAPQIPIHTARSHPEVAAALEAAADTDVLVVHGGDGTVQLVLTELLARRPFARLPLLAFVPGGTTNLIAHDVGAGGDLARVVHDLARWCADPAQGGFEVRRRHALGVRAADAPAADAIYGMFFGAAGLYAATHVCRDWRARAEALHLPGALGTAAAIVRLTAPMLIGRAAVAPTTIALSTESGYLPAVPYALAIATTLHRFAFGVWPFWERNEAPMQMFLLRQHPRHLARVLWPLLRGRAHPRLEPRNGYHHVGAQTAELAFDGGYAIDGELFEAAESRPIVLDARAEVGFVCPVSRPR